MDLTVAGFVIAVFGIILQMADAFPKHREARNAVVLLALGVFLGTAASAMLRAKYNITGNVDRQFVLLFSLVGAAAIFGLVAVFVDSAEKRAVAINLAGAAGIMFLLSGLAVGLGAASGNRVAVYSTDEVLLLANAAEQKGQYEVAVERLQELKGRLESSEARQQISQRITRLQAAQAGAKTP